MDRSAWTGGTRYRLYRTAHICLRLYCCYTAYLLPLPYHTRTLLVTRRAYAPAAHTASATTFVDRHFRVCQNSGRGGVKLDILRRRIAPCSPGDATFGAPWLLIFNGVLLSPRAGSLSASAPPTASVPSYQTRRCSARCAAPRTASHGAARCVVAFATTPPTLPALLLIVVLLPLPPPPPHAPSTPPLPPHSFCLLPCPDN